MALQVIVYASAEADIDEAFVNVERRAPRTAADWLRRFQKQIEDLSDNAMVFPPAMEARKTKLPLREALFGKRPNVFRVIFLIEGEEVRVLRAVRGQRRPLTRRQIDAALETRPPDTSEQNGSG